MILLQLFWNFLVIGAVSFGGGYGMISLVRETVLGHGWLTESEFLSFIAVFFVMRFPWRNPPLVPLSIPRYMRR